MTKETNDTVNGTLFVVSTPIGNLQDITLRALHTLKTADVIACEDTRVTKKLLIHYNISASCLISYGNHNLISATKKILSILQTGKNVALVSDAGTPLVSDPGYELIKECYKHNITVTTVPGPCSVISALLLSKVFTKTFYFGGFFANKTSEIAQQLNIVKNIDSVLVFFVAANKLAKVIPIIQDVFTKDHKIACVREITKIYEEAILDTLENILYKANNNLIKGEVVLVIPTIKKTFSIKEQTKELEKLLNTHSLKDALAKLDNYYKQKGFKINKKELYSIGINLNK